MSSHAAAVRRLTLSVGARCASVRVEQCIHLEGLPLEDAYAMRTVTTATPAAQDSTATAGDAELVPALAGQQLSITVEGAIECNAGASATGLKGVIEGILYSQVSVPPGPPLRPCRLCLAVQGKDHQSRLVPAKNANSA